MKLWMDVMRDIEHVLDDYERIFDAWEAGGIDGLVIGPLFFNQPKLMPGTRFDSGQQPLASFAPNPRVYQQFGVATPTDPVAEVQQQRRLDQMLQAAKDRGWAVWLFQAGAGAGADATGNPIVDDLTQRALAARMVDALQHYPMVDGAIMDGPEWGYEIAPHHMNHRSYIFNDLPESAAAKCQELGYDYPALVAAKDRLFANFHTLKSSHIALHAHGGLLGGARLFQGDPDLFAWLQFRVDSLTAFFQGIRTQVDAALDYPIKLGVGPRSAAFAPLCGYDFVRLAEFLDILLPKHYFFQRGFDGMLGTIYRYVETLVHWNPGLTDGEALAVVAALFGLSLPNVSNRDDLESALSPEFFARIVTQETVRALAAVDNPERIVPWVDTGRWPHDGDPMSPRDLLLLLQSADSAGLKRFLYHHHGNLSAGEWAVISRFCGTPWRGLESSYQPPDMAVL
ncbi:MAG: hypothetical protein WAU10_17190 [Caldilineaceae bacterium]